MLQAAWMVALALSLPLGFGIWLDRRVGATPLFLVAGAVLGIIVATVSAVWVASREIAALGALPEAESAPEEKQEKGKEDTA
jgi:F0F1-type ATP synthase assembly protein I